VGRWGAKHNPSGPSLAVQHSHHVLNRLGYVTFKQGKLKEAMQ